MKETRTRGVIRVALVLAVVAIAMLATACGKKADEPAANGDTALGNLTVAESAVATAAPDARLLLVEATGVVGSTESRVWTYIFGSPETNQMFSVSVTEGQSMGAVSGSQSPLTEDEWNDVPENASWKVDSDEAYDKAFEARTKQGDVASYSILLYTHIPDSAGEEAGAREMAWYVTFATPEGAISETIEVDAETGEATVMAP